MDKTTSLERVMANFQIAKVPSYYMHAKFGHFILITAVAYKFKGFEIFRYVYLDNSHE
ncbi:MAG: hypothetical protein K8S18_22285 [Desulfobacula sp.]|nr:hypothetical protein [Desulfobacula sp.]